VILRYFNKSEALTVGGAPPNDDDPHWPQVIGSVAAGVWIAMEGGMPIEQEKSPFPPDPRFPREGQFDLIIQGSSINRFARDGERIRCVSVESGINVHEGDYVVVERRKEGGALLETTVKRLRRTGEKVELWPDSDDPRYKDPIIISDPQTDEVRIVAKVFFAYRTAPNSL